MKCEVSNWKAVNYHGRCSRSRRAHCAKLPISHTFGKNMHEPRIPPILSTKNPASWLLQEWTPLQTSCSWLVYALHSMQHFDLCKLHGALTANGTYSWPALYIENDLSHLIIIHLNCSAHDYMSVCLQYNRVLVCGTANGWFLRMSTRVHIDQIIITLSQNCPKLQRLEIQWDPDTIRYSDNSSKFIDALR